MNFVKFLRAPVSIEHLWWLTPNAAPATYATTANTNNTTTSTTAATFVSYCVSYPLMYQVFLRTTNLLLHHYYLLEYGLLLRYSFFQPLLTVSATGLQTEF